MCVCAHVYVCVWGGAMRARAGLSPSRVCYKTQAFIEFLPVIVYDYPTLFAQSIFPSLTINLPGSRSVPRCLCSYYMTKEQLALTIVIFNYSGLPFYSQNSSHSPFPRCFQILPHLFVHIPRFTTKRGNSSYISLVSFSL